MTFPAPPDVKNGTQLPGAEFGSTSTVWVCRFGPYNRKRYLTRMVIVPPSAALVSTMLIVFNENRKIGVSPTGTSTGFAPKDPEPITAGTVLNVVWFVNGGTPPEVTISTREDLI
jgi:hypothetical protein